MMITNKGKFINAIGWGVVGLGLYLVTYGYMMEDDRFEQSKQEDGVIDLEFTVVD